MTLVLPPEEPAAGPWLTVRLADFVRLLPQGQVSPERPTIVAVDGRSGGGKTTLADRLCRALPGSRVVRTDDVAWHHSFFGWSHLLVDGILRPLHDNQAVAYQPPAWRERGRQDAIQVPRHCPVVIVEGVGSGRRELAPWIDSLIWVQSDVEVAQRRGIARDGGDKAAADFWAEWMAEELPFLAEQRPWERASLVVSGTPAIPHDPSAEVITCTGPLPR